eukprot:9731283-Alexandrium_andersonii.AAC.1
MPSYRRGVRSSDPEGTSSARCPRLCCLSWVPCRCAPFPTYAAQLEKGWELNAAVDALLQWAALLGSVGAVVVLGA